MNQDARGVGFDSRKPLSPPPGRKFLFGIAIDNYYSSPLRNAVKDLDDIVTVLCEKYDFEPENVTRLINEEATRSKIINTLYSYTSSSKLGTNDSLLIYFSGHGYFDQDNDDGYWIPVDSSPNDIASMIENVTVKTRISQMKCRHILLISDSCFSGSLLSKDSRLAPKNRLAAELERKNSRWIITSGRSHETVLDATNSNRVNSPFAAAMLSELRLNANAKLLADDLASKVRQITWNNSSQVPQFERIREAGDMGGHFVFTLRDAERGAWQVTLAKNTTSAYESFIEIYPNSFYVDEANNRIAALVPSRLTSSERAVHLLEQRVNEWVNNDRINRYLLRFVDWQFIVRHQPADFGENRANKEELLIQSTKLWLSRIAACCLLLSLFIGFSFWWQSKWGQLWQMERTLYRSTTSDTQETKVWTVQTLVIIGKHAQALSAVNSSNSPLSKESKARVLPDIAMGFAQHKDTIQAKYILAEALTASESLTEDYKTKALLNITQKYTQLKDQMGLIKVLRATNDLSNKYKVRVLSEIAQEFIHINDTLHAKSTLEEAFIATRSLSNLQKASILPNIAQGFTQIKETPQAKSIVAQTITITHLLADFDKIHILPIIAQSYIQLKDTLQAKAVLNEALSASSLLTDDFQKASVLPIIAQGFVHLQDKLGLQKVVAATYSLEDKLKASILLIITQDFIKLEDTQQATAVIVNSLTVTNSLTNFSKVQILLTIAQAHLRLKDTLQAKAAMVKALTATDSLTKLDKDRVLMAIALQFATLDDCVLTPFYEPVLTGV